MKCQTRGRLSDYMKTDNKFQGMRAECGIYDDYGNFTPEEKETIRNMLDNRSYDTGINILNDKFWIDYDICSNRSFSADAFDALMNSIEASRQIKKPELRKTWITTSNVYDALFKEFIISDNKFIIAPQYILPTGEDAVIISENCSTPNRAERRKKQKEERRRNKK